MFQIYRGLWLLREERPLLFCTFLSTFFLSLAALGKGLINTSVVDPWYFGTGTCTTDLRIRILLFSSVAENMLTKNKFLFPKFFCFYFFECTFTSVFKDKKSKNSRVQGFFLLLLLVDIGNHGRIPIQEAQYLRILRIRLWIHITDKYIIFDLIRTQFVFVFFLFGDLLQLVRII